MLLCVHQLAANSISLPVHGLAEQVVDSGFKRCFYWINMENMDRKIPK